MAYDSGAGPNGLVNCYFVLSYSTGRISTTTVPAATILSTTPSTPSDGGASSFPAAAVGYLWPRGDGTPAAS